MSEKFKEYSRYYDLLYRDKDYTLEADYISSLLFRFGGKVRSVLELGCGTGKHAMLLAASGMRVTGVEFSETMLHEACLRAESLGPSQGTFTPVAGDARSVRLGRFDAVISLFHVVSYQVSNEDALAIFRTAASHLSKDGVFIFDVWYAPAVLANLPSVRVKRMADAQTSIIRIAEPTSNVNESRVDVQYTVIVSDKSTGETVQLLEKHPMRYFSSLELDLLAAATGMKIIHAEEWMTRATPSENTWGVCFVAQKL